MGKILFLDDMEERHKAFLKVSIGHEVVQVWCAEDAIAALKESQFDQVFLDHDLSEDDIMVRVGEDSKVPTGMTVVDHIMTMDAPPQDIIVHSCNGPAAWHMATKLEGHQSKGKVRKIAFPFLLQLMRGVYT
jgi:predicted O-methyltransferase YrrM